ncbi:MAG: sialidase family protein [Brumimicrobium sp.]|nr:sialidase family protein [Brumimicrobium sp.]
MRIATLFLGFCSILSLSASFCQEFKLIELPRPETATYPYSQVEPSIAIHPHKPKLMIAGSVMNDYYYSRNGGKTWKSKSLSSEYNVNGDPVMHIGQDGRYYYFHLSNPVNGNYLDRIVCDYSDRLKGKWTSSATKPDAPKAQDKHWVAECPITGNLYLTWTQFDEYDSSKPGDSSRIMFSKSADKGQTWTEPAIISTLQGDCLDGDNTVEGAVPAVNSKGELFVVWTGPHGLRINISSDQGESWLPVERKITDHIGGWSLDVPGLSRCNGLPVLKIDNSSGPNHGRLYVNWADQRNGSDDTDIWLIYSDDGGMTWSREIRVNQDEGANQQFLTWMDIDQTDGTVYFVYYDRRNYSDQRTDVFLAYSWDGGLNIAERKITHSPFIPNPKVFFGDYLNIAVHKDIIRPIWSQMNVEGEISLWVALINRKQLLMSKTE